MWISLEREVKPVWTVVELCNCVSLGFSNPKGREISFVFLLILNENFLHHWSRDFHVTSSFVNLRNNVFKLWRWCKSANRGSLHIIKHAFDKFHFWWRPYRFDNLIHHQRYKTITAKLFTIKLSFIMFLRFSLVLSLFCPFYYPSTLITFNTSSSVLPLCFIIDLSNIFWQV